ncbi:hypothetical protein [Massilia pseudoviolaceinigra]|uniref:hypothetical protein n=1 Tax=Massilia pseudoviolaceinigra TaxID=3057165 RepID=UPI002796670B|nr:hypothetical protein [Massilia sp. CCM 9206]MDQ1920280.1 hypothetical protein [Massilia sp. CCM 9206]
MAKAGPSQAVLDQLVPIMVETGYKYRKKNHSFLRHTGPASQEFIVLFDGRGGFVSVTGADWVRFDKLDALSKKLTGTGIHHVAGGGFAQTGVVPRQYDIYDSAYASLTPKQKGAVDPALVHPQERVDAAVRFIVDTHERYVVPLFDRVNSYRALADFLLEGLRGGDVLFPQVPHAIPMALLLAAVLGDDPSEILAHADRCAPIYTGSDIRALVAAMQNAIRQARPEDLLLQ